MESRKEITRESFSRMVAVRIKDRCLQLANMGLL